MSTQNLGPLEKQVMDCIWEARYVTVRDVHTCLQERKKVAYTTIMTIMTRLHEKGFLKRKMEGRSYVYSAKKSKKQTTKSIVGNIFNSLVDQYGQEAVVAFSDELDKASRENK